VYNPGKGKGSRDPSIERGGGLFNDLVEGPINPGDGDGDGDGDDGDSDSINLDDNGNGDGDGDSEGGVGDSDSGGPHFENCYIALSVDILQFPALETIPVNPSDIDNQSLGTKYIYNDIILDMKNMEELDGSFATGSCSRTQTRLPLGDAFVSGGGYCHFTYTLFDGDNTMSFNVAGEVFDGFNNTLAVTGGTESFLGVTGQITLQPMDLTEGGEFVQDDGDFFTDPSIYTAKATLFFNQCLLDFVGDGDEEEL
jgi:hypothetical protein